MRRRSATVIPSTQDPAEEDIEQAQADAPPQESAEVPDAERFAREEEIRLGQEDERRRAEWEKNERNRREMLEQQQANERKRDCSNLESEAVRHFSQGLGSLHSRLGIEEDSRVLHAVRLLKDGVQVLQGSDAEHVHKDTRDRNVAEVVKELEEARQTIATLTGGSEAAGADSGQPSPEIPPDGGGEPPSDPLAGQ